MIAKAKPGVPGARDYIGASDGPANAKRPGTEMWVRQAAKYSNGALWNNGTFMRRDIKGKPGQMSVHSTGRAIDLSYRKMPNKGIDKGRNTARQFFKKVVANANQLGVQMVIDYRPKPWGASWRCDRQAWKKYSKPTISGAPGGDWFHIEITPQAADSVIFVKAAFLKVFGEIPPKA